MTDELSFLAWPRFLNRQQAAVYVGVGVDTFMDEVRAGVWPHGRPRGGRGGKLTWDRKLLDLAADRFASLNPVQQSRLPDPAADELMRRIDIQLASKKQIGRKR